MRDVLRDDLFSFLLGVTDFKAVKGSSSAEERSAALQPGLLLLLAGAAAVTILFAAVTCVAVTLRRQASFKLIYFNLNIFLAPYECNNNKTEKILFHVGFFSSVVAEKEIFR